MLAYGCPKNSIVLGMLASRVTRSHDIVVYIRSFRTRITEPVEMGPGSVNLFSIPLTRISGIFWNKYPNPVSPVPAKPFSTFTRVYFLAHIPHWVFEEFLLRSVTVSSKLRRMISISNFENWV